ncbi:hypothetical protein BH23THE1_BH23THE1_15990 [soil metagenome]
MPVGRRFNLAVVKDRVIKVLVCTIGSTLPTTYTLMEFPFGLDQQNNAYSRDIQKFEGLIRCCLPTRQTVQCDRG